MSLYTSHTAAGRVVDTELSVTYTKSKIYGSWTYSAGIGNTITIYSAWQYVRRARKNYRYVGLTHEAAVACQTALVAYYTRSIKVSEVSSANVNDDPFIDVDGGDVPMVEVACVHVKGPMWEVRVSVNEVDTRLRTSSALSTSVLFTAENAREYDDDGDSFYGDTNAA